ncbi:hybrid sensor histidine kinase/response regulator [bacterium]|nr:hybrid sensor histidine kinase/response regulator [bacterium]
MEFSEKEFNEILSIFETESDVILKNMTDALSKLEKSPKNQDYILEIFRNAHSLKGAARMLDFHNTQALAHKIEDVLDAAKSENLVINEDVIDELWKSLDLININIKNSILAKKEVTSDDIPNQIKTLDKLLNTGMNGEKQPAENNNADFSDIMQRKSEIGDLIKKASSVLKQIPVNTETPLISELFELSEKLYNIFSESDLFNVKKAIEDIKVKLSFVKQLSNKLTTEEISEIESKLNEANSVTGTDNNVQSEETEYPKVSIVRVDLNEKNQSIADEVSKIVDFVNEKNITLSDEMKTVLQNSMDYCNNSNNETDDTLVKQQLEILKQLLETDYEQQNVQITAVNDITQFKTLNVNSVKLDMFVSQLGELIANKMETTQSLNELNEIKQKISQLQDITDKAIKQIKNYKVKGVNDNQTVQTLINNLSDALKEENDSTYRLKNSVTKLIGKTNENEIKSNMIIDEIELLIKDMRILPLSSILNVFPRMVKDIAKEQGKEITFIINGDETGADKKIIEEIKAPLMHIIRNSVDHGIELPEKRLEKGKDRKGKILLNVRQEDNKIKIDIIDDGQGFNLEKIKEKALAKGFLTQEDINSMSDDEITNIIFWPGFTTEDNVTDISGRGIGLDIVKSKLADLNGKIKVVSEFGKGCCTSIEIPVNLTTFKAFITEVANQYFAIPISVIDTFVLKNSDEIHETNGKKSLLYDNKIIPLYYLSAILNLEIPKPKAKETILIVDIDNSKTAIVVDKLVGYQDIFQKKLPVPIIKLKNISGITTLPTGENCLILNMTDVLKTASVHIHEAENRNLFKFEDISAYKKVLLVDDNETMRIIYKKIIENTGLNVDAVSSSEEGLINLNNANYDLIVTDYEMPDKNGIEFIRDLKQNEKFNNIPIIMLSSREDTQTINEALISGADAYIIKDKTDEELVNTIKNLIIKYNN